MELRRLVSGRARTVGRASSGWVPVLLLACAVPLAAQTGADPGGVVEGARLLAVVEPDGSAAVTLEYALAPGDELSVPLDMLGFGDAVPTEIGVAGAEGATVLWPSSGSRRSAAVDALEAVDGQRRLTLRYRVEGAVSFDGVGLRAHIPVVSVDWPPAAEAGAVFEAEIVTPPGWMLSESFPTGLALDAESGAHEVSLAVVPAVVSFRGRTDGAWRPGVPLLIDLFALTVFLTFSLFGWKHLREAAA